MPKPRILHVISELNIGGTELSLTRVLPHLQTDFDNQVVCLIGQGAVGQKLAEHNIPVHYLNGASRFNPAAITELAQLIKELKPAALVTYLIYADMIGRLAARFRNVPVISAQRSSLHKRPYLRWPEQLTSSLVTHYVVQTEAARDWVTGSNVTVIPNAVEPSPSPNLPLRADPRRKSYPASMGPSPPRAGPPAMAGWRSRRTCSSELIRGGGKLTTKKLKIICVSNLRPGKGHDVLLGALKTLSQQVQTQIVGDGPLRAALEQQTKELRLEDNVSFLGLRNDVPKLLAANDIFTLPSLAEGMSNALLEAMAAGLPVVASDIPANRAVIEDQQTGLLVPPGDAPALNQALQTVISDPDLRQRLGRQAQVYVQQQHAPSKIAAAWAKVLHQTTAP